MIYALSINRSALWQKPWLVLGDSISKGIASIRSKALSAIENSFVEKIKSDLRLDIMNLSVFGATAEKVLNSLIATETVNPGRCRPAPVRRQ